MSKKKNEEWNEQYCTISAETDSSGAIVCYKGTYGNSLARARFTIHRQRSGEYLMRGRLSMRSLRESTRVLSRANGTPLSADIRIKADHIETVRGVGYRVVG